MTDLPTSLPCNWARTRQPHPPHDWEPQPGMVPVHCPGRRQGDTDEPELTAEEARTLAEHYEECPQYDNPTAPHCHCEGINQADDNYWTEPPNLNG
ncbi:hypothetical protein [Streptomyces rubrogriseus]|uniref:hypothetical protein n=1 Tax=Streptomyces rubrogriseus TaxID=194673 RepID=UPI000D58D2BF|nr:hypothetical protein [Streptomyces rubrogriseus]